MSEPKFKHLLEPLKIGNYVLKNRMCVSNSLPHFLQGPETYPADTVMAHYENKAKSAAIVTCMGINNFSRDMIVPMEADFTHFPDFDLYNPACQNYLMQMVDAIHYHNSIACMGIFVGPPSGYPLEKEDGSLEMLLRYESPDPTADLTESRTMTLVLENLTADREVLVEGRWEVPISLSSVETQPPLVLENVTVPLTEDGVTRQVTYQKVEVTATGVQLTCAPQAWEDALAFYDVALVLKDGSEVPSQGGNANWEGEADASLYVGSLTWKLPVDLDQAAALRFGQTTVPLT